MNASQRPAHVRLIDRVSFRNAQQWGGLALVFANVLFVVNKLDEMSRLFLARPMPDLISGQDAGLILVGQVALIIGYVAYYLVYAPRVGWSGKVALACLCGGGSLLAVGHVAFMSAFGAYVPTALVRFAEDIFVLVVFGLLLLLLGLIWFGVFNLRHPVVRQWPWLPLVTGLLGFVGFILFSGEDITATFLVFRTLFAGGLIGLGLTLWMEQPGQADLGSHEKNR